MCPSSNHEPTKKNDESAAALYVIPILNYYTN
jgi:hypothetical protein